MPLTISASYIRRLYLHFKKISFAANIGKTNLSKPIRHIQLLVIGHSGRSSFRFSTHISIGIYQIYSHRSDFICIIEIPIFINKILLIATMNKTSCSWPKADFNRQPLRTGDNWISRCSEDNFFFLFRLCRISVYRIYRYTSILIRKYSHQFL